MKEVRSQTFEIRAGDIETVAALSKLIPEFINPHQAEEYYKRLMGVPHSILGAFVDNQPVGFKVGYEREGKFYSWMGVLPPNIKPVGSNI